MVVDYSHAKVYKIYSPSRPDIGIYIGSTVQALSARMATHRGLYRHWKSGNTNFTSSFPILEVGDALIVLLEDVPCQRKEQLLARERFWIETTECVNRVIPQRTLAEWYVANREVLTARKSEVVTCECGCRVRRDHLRRHRKTSKHLNIMDQQLPVLTAE